MRVSPRSTSTQTYLLLPAAVAAELGVRRALGARMARRPSRHSDAPSAAAATGVLLMAVGYALYRATGSYRVSRGGGPPGMSQGLPERLVDTGPYAWSRNPMYLGHLTFQAGVLLARPTVVAGVALVWRLRWFQDRVLRDEQRLRELWGGEYEDYLTRVPRWAGRPRPAGPPRQQPRSGPRR